MLIGMRNAMMAGKRLSAKSYVQDGLVAMWDGIENAGWGVHDPNATVWKDLSGNGYDHDILQGTWLDNCLYQGWAYSYQYDTRARNFWTAYNSNASATLQFLLAPGNSWDRPNVVHSLFGEFKFALWETNGNRIFNSSGACLVPNNTATAGRWDDQLLTFAQDTTDVYYYVNTEFKLKTASSYSTCPDVSREFLAFGHVNKAYCLRIYNKQLSPSEIAANYAVDKARFNLPDAT